MRVQETQIGVAVVGLGVGEQHLRSFLDADHCQVRWLYDLNPDKCKRLAQELGCRSIANSFEQILEDPDVQVISIASYDDAHFSQIIQALRAGKHLFVEKPLCRSFKELEAIKKVWTDNGSRLLASNLVLRAAPLYQWLKGQIEQDRLGEIYAFDGDYLYGRLEKITHGWRKDVVNYSVMQGGGVHLVDLMLWLTGAKPIRVSAVGNKLCTRDSDFQYNDYVAAAFEFPSGIIGRITANFGCVHRHQHVVRLYGTKGTFLYDDQGARFHESRDCAVPPIVIREAPEPASQGALIPGFVDSLISGKQLYWRTQHEFDLIAVCIAVDAALEQRKAVEVRYV